MKIAFLGNSHLSAIKLGWDAASYQAEHQALFFGSSRDKMKTLRVTDGKLQAGDAELARLFQLSADRTDIPADCDLYVLVGLQSAMTRGMGVLKTHALYGSGQGRNDARLLSRAALRATLRDQIEFGLALRTFRTLRAVTDAPVVLLPDPFVSEAALQDDRFRHWRDPGVRHEVQALHAQAVAEFLTPVMTVCWQPPQTVVEGAFTRHEYIRNATRLSGTGYTAALGDDDMIHANASFGVAMLDEMFAAVQAARPANAA